MRIEFFEESRRRGIHDLELRRFERHEIGLPVEIRRQNLQVSNLDLVLAFVGIATLHARHGRIGQRGLKTHHCGRVFLRCFRTLAQQLEHLLHMLHIALADLFGFGVVFDVVVAVWKSEPALEDCGNLLFRVIGVLV